MSFAKDELRHKVPEGKWTPNPFRNEITKNGGNIYAAHADSVSTASDGFARAHPLGAPAGRNVASSNAVADLCSCQLCSFFFSVKLTKPLHFNSHPTAFHFS
jgi:hypothetical protein